MSNNVYEVFGTNKSIEESGIILDYGEFQIKIARAGGSNKRFEKILEQHTRSYRRSKIDLDQLPRPVMEKVLHRVYAEGVVLGWQGVKDREGNDMPYSIDNCIKLFQDLPDLWADVVNQATSIANFKAQALESESKN